MQQQTGEPQSPKMCSTHPCPAGSAGSGRGRWPPPGGSAAASRAPWLPGHQPEGSGAHSGKQPPAADASLQPLLWEKARAAWRHRPMLRQGQHQARGRAGAGGAPLSPTEPSWGLRVVSGRTVAGSRGCSQGRARPRRLRREADEPRHPLRHQAVLKGVSERSGRLRYPENSRAMMTRESRRLSAASPQASLLHEAGVGFIMSRCVRNSPADSSNAGILKGPFGGMYKCDSVAGRHWQDLGTTSPPGGIA